MVRLDRELPLETSTPSSTANGQTLRWHGSFVVGPRAERTTDYSMF